MKLLVPVFDLSLVAPVVKAAKAGGHLVAIANPDSGPGRGNSTIPGWPQAINQLKAAGVTVIYYVDLVQQDGDAGYSGPAFEKVEAKLKAEMAAYEKRYGKAQGWFFDDLWDYTAKRGTLLTNLVKAAAPGTLTVANPGTGVTKDYLKTGINVLVTWETEDYVGSTPSSWEAANAPRVAAMALGESDFHAALNVAKQRKVALFFATDGTDEGDAYDHMPAYLTTLAKAA